MRQRNPLHVTNKLIGLLLVLPLVGAEPAGYKYWSAAEMKGMAKPLSNKSNVGRRPKTWEILAWITL